MGTCGPGVYFHMSYVNKMKLGTSHYILVHSPQSGAKTINDFMRSYFTIPKSYPVSLHGNGIYSLFETCELAHKSYIFKRKSQTVSF